MVLLIGIVCIKGYRISYNKSTLNIVVLTVIVCYCYTGILFKTASFMLKRLDWQEGVRISIRHTPRPVLSSVKMKQAQAQGQADGLKRTISRCLDSSCLYCSL